MRRRPRAYAYQALTIIALLLVALLACGCLTPRQEWRHQNEDVLPVIHAQIDEAYLSGRIDKAKYDELLRWGNLYREAVVSWGVMLMDDDNPAAKKAEALRLLAKIEAELQRELNDG